MSSRARFLGVLALAGAVACAKRLPPLAGTPVPVRIPRAELDAGHSRIVFRWELEDRDLIARGEGAARVAPPDSARLDFFVGGGVGAGAAVFISDQLRLQDQASDMRRMVPPPSLLWASLGRLALPPSADTAAGTSGDTLRVDLGQPIVWRVTFVRDTLIRLERVERGRVLEWVERSVDGRSVRYNDHVERRRLDLSITRTEPVSAFDPAIWSLR